MNGYDIFYNEEFMRQHRQLIADAEQATIVSTPQQALCKCCGQPLIASTPAQPTLAKDANVASEAPPSGWRDREKLL